MITPLLLLKERIVRFWEAGAATRSELNEILHDLDHAIDQQKAEDRAHREEVETLIFNEGRK